MSCGQKQGARVREASLLKAEAVGLAISKDMERCGLSFQFFFYNYNVYKKISCACYGIDGFR